VIDGRKRAAGAFATLCIAALGGSVLVASPSTADPSIGDVRVRVERLYHEAEQASERYNDARLRLHEARTRWEALQSDLDRQRDRVEAVRDQVAADVVAQAQGQALSTASQLLLADDPDEFLSELTTLSAYNAQRADVVAQLGVQVDRLEVREGLAQKQVDTMAQARTQLAEEKAQIDERAAEAKSLLGRLEEQQRRRQELARQRAERQAAQRDAQRVSRSSVRVPVSTAPASGRASAAVAYAMAQVGDAYVYGAAGPSAFDCSGLTMMAWAAAGVSLPHSSSAQMGSGTPVSTSALQPGDLVFYYSPVSHVAMYIGNGMIVHAANPSVGVEVSPLSSMPLAGAVRPG
jgi:cell wall-associated NlpC family hydrolase